MTRVVLAPLFALVGIGAAGVAVYSVALGITQAAIIAGVVAAALMAGAVAVWRENP